jgi:hypothetical protein
MTGVRGETHVMASMFVPAPVPGFGGPRARSRLGLPGKERRESDMDSTSAGGQEPGGDVFGGPEPDEQRTDTLGGNEPGGDVLGDPEPDEQRTDTLGGSDRP